MSTPSVECGPNVDVETNPLTDETVTISRGELEQLRSLARASAVAKLVASAESDAREATPAEPHAETSTRREEALTLEVSALDRKVFELDSAYRKALRDRELATALAGKPLVAGAATQLIKLWGDDLDVYEESGKYQVAARDGRTVAEWVADRLGGHDYAHFCLPTSRGGVRAKGVSQASAADGASSSVQTLGEAVVSQWRESATARAGAPQGPAGWGRRR